MRVFIAALCHESSSFSPIPTSRRSFEEFEYFRPSGQEGFDWALDLNGYGAFVRRALDAGDEPILSTYTFAQPSGPAVQEDYESLRDEILSDLERAGQIDAVLLFLHGAQMADGYDDCEGDVLARARAIVGRDTFIGAELDLHANITEDMLVHADALVACRHYPHIDFNERAEHLYDIAQATVSGRLKPKMHYRRIPMLGIFYTTEPQLASVNAAALEIQDKTQGVISVSLIHGFPWTDMPALGAGVLMITDGSDVNVEESLNRLAKDFFNARKETSSLRISVDNALDIAETDGSRDGPVVLADPCDNAGGGAPSDSTFILQRILDRGLSGYALGMIWDQVAVQMAFDLGEGARFGMRLGGKCGPSSGAPVDAMVKIVRLKRDMAQIGIGYTHPIGDAALLEVDGNFIVICTTRGQVFSPSCFTDLGLDLSVMTGVVVKSTQHFYDQFAPIASQIVYCETHGAMTLDFQPDLYKRAPRPIWPLDEIERV